MQQWTCPNAKDGRVHFRNSGVKRLISSLFSKLLKIRPVILKEQKTLKGVEAYGTPKPSDYSTGLYEIHTFLYRIGTVYYIMQTCPYIVHVLHYMMRQCHYIMYKQLYMICYVPYIMHVTLHILAQHYHHII